MCLLHLQLPLELPLLCLLFMYLGLDLLVCKAAQARDSEVAEGRPGEYKLDAVAPCGSVGVS